jgi:hypothetical protein
LLTLFVGGGIHCSSKSGLHRLTRPGRRRRQRGPITDLCRRPFAAVHPLNSAAKRNCRQCAHPYTVGALGGGSCCCSWRASCNMVSDRSSHVGIVELQTGRIDQAGSCRLISRAPTSRAGGPPIRLSRDNLTLAACIAGHTILYAARGASASGGGSANGAPLPAQLEDCSLGQPDMTSLLF